jgi:hypothetical protein
MRLKALVLLELFGSAVAMVAMGFLGLQVEKERPGKGQEITS